MKISKGRFSNRILAGTMTFIMALSVMMVPVSAKAENTDLVGSDPVGAAIAEADLGSELLEVELQKISGITVLKGKALQTVNSLTNSLGDSTTTVTDRNWRAYCSQYVFDQMNAEEKELYNNLETVCMNFAKSSSENAIKYKDYDGYYLTPAEYKDLDSDQLNRVIQLFVYQNPQYYFVTIDLACLYTNKEVYLPCYEEFADGETRAKVTNSLFGQIDKVVADISKAEKSEETRDYDIECAAHDYLCNELSYDVKADFNQSIYGVFTSKSTVCLGYSLSMELLLNAAGVHTVTAYSDIHAWNKVLVGNNWYAVDVTWDDQDWGIANNWFNRSDANICKKDTEYEHTMKDPEYFPAASADYFDASYYAADDETDDSSENTTVANSNVQSNTTVTDKAEDQSAASTVSPVVSSSDTVETIEIEEDSDEDEEPIEITGTKLSKVKAGSKKCTITWKKVKNIDGYEIQLSTSKKFKKIAKKAKVSSSKSTTTIKKLKKKTTYYVRIRTYKKVNGKTQTSSWSGVKKVTIK